MLLRSLAGSLGLSSLCFFFNDPATTEIYTLSLHDALPTSRPDKVVTVLDSLVAAERLGVARSSRLDGYLETTSRSAATDRKSTRLNSSHGYISYAVFCLKKKTTSNPPARTAHGCTTTTTS